MNVSGKSVAQAKREWKNSRFVVLNDVLDIKHKSMVWWEDVQEELEFLEARAQYISPNPHSRYKQLMPEYLLSTPRHKALGKSQRGLTKHSDWALLSLYYSSELLQLIKQITGWKDVQRLPISRSRAFEINGKLNFYDANDSSFLDWHYDKVRDYKGKQVVCVLTLSNSNDLANASERHNTLEGIYMQRGKFFRRAEYLGGNSMSLHDPDALFHRVLPFKRSPGIPSMHACKRTIFIMRFTDDATPQTALYKHLGLAKYLVRNAAGFVYVGDMKWIGICLFICVLLLACLRSILLVM
jgi:hypothetical protein